MTPNPNLTLFYGENQTALKKELFLWKNAFFQKYPDTTNFSEFKDPQNQLASIKDEIQTPPFLGDKRLIFIYNLNSCYDTKFSKLFSTLPQTSIVLIIEEQKLAKNAKIIGAIKKIGQVKEFSSSPADLHKTALQQVKNLGVQIDPYLLKELILKLENNPSKIENELVKLALFASDGKIKNEDIEQIVKFSVNISVFQLMDDISAKNTKKAIRNLGQMLESGEEPTKVFYLLARQIRILIQLKSLVEQNAPSSKIAELTGIHPFIVKKTLPLLKNFSLNKLHQVLEQILQMDIKLKTGGIKFSKNNQTELLLNIEVIILDLCD